MRRSAVLALASSIACGGAPADERTADERPAIVPVLATAAVAHDPDDPAVWVDRANPSRSLVLGTNKVASPDGALYVFALDGTVRQTLGPLDRPNNVDVEYGLASPQGAVDVAVVTERLQHRLRVYRVAEDGLTPLDGGRGIPVLDGQIGERAEPMGIALYRRPADGTVFAIVAPKTGGPVDYLWQYRLDVDPDTGEARGTLVRRFGHYAGTSEIEAVAVDDALGHVYYSDEEFGIRKWHADPDHPDAGTELAVFGRAGFVRQREGIGILARPDGTGYIAVSDQIPGATRLVVFSREGRPGRPHDHEPALATLTTPADSTDGIEIVASGLPEPFAEGLLVMMNSAARNFLFFRWSDVVRFLERAGSSVPDPDR